MRWFGVVRKRDGGLRAGSAKQSEFPSHREFLKRCLSYDRGDMVLELFQNNLLTEPDFMSYVREYYLGERPTIQQMR